MFIAASSLPKPSSVKELNHITLGVSINMTLLTELGVLKHYGLCNVTPERPCAKRVAAGGKVPPRPLPYGRGSD